MQMKFNITHQETYSRGELILRSLFGPIYMFLPHMFLLGIFGIWAQILRFISFWVILFTGRYPESMFEYQVKFMRWNLRLNARMWNLADDYPAFGLEGTDEYTEFDVAYPESIDRVMVLVKAFFGVFYVALPHGLILIFRMWWGSILSFLAFWSVLFTGEYPPAWHRFNVETLRWGQRVQLYLAYMTEEYPPFSGRPE